MLSVVKLEEVNGNPTVKLDLPPAQIGDPVGLRFRITRRNNGRTEELRADGQFRVTARGIDASQGLPRQLLTVEPVGKAPVWRSVKNKPLNPRRLAPAKHPKTSI